MPKLKKCRRKIAADCTGVTYSFSAEYVRVRLRDYLFSHLHIACAPHGAQAAIIGSGLTLCSNTRIPLASCERQAGGSRAGGMQKSAVYPEDGG